MVPVGSSLEICFRLVEVVDNFDKLDAVET